MEKANSLIEAEDDNIEPLTGSGALSGPVPSGTSSSLSGRPRPGLRFAAFHAKAGAGEKLGATARTKTIGHGRLS